MRDAGQDMKVPTLLFVHLAVSCSGDRDLVSPSDAHTVLEYPGMP